MNQQFQINRRRARSRRVIMVLLVATLLIFSTATVWAASGGGHGETKGWVIEDTWRVMNFTVLVVGLYLLLRKPVGNALNARIEGIRDQLEDLESRKDVAENKLAEYKKKLALLESESQQIVDDYVKQGQAAKARILETAKASAQKLEEQAQKNIAYEFEQAKARLKNEVMDKAMAEAQELIESQINAEDQNRLVDDYLKKVEV